MLGSNHDVWYVRASFGTEWGPISASTLLEMADSGSLARDDLARSERDVDWFPVQQAIDHLRDLRTMSVAATVDESLEEEHDENQNFDSADSPTIELPESNVGAADATTMAPVAHRKSRLGALPGWSNYWTPNSPQSLIQSPTPVAQRHLQSAPETSIVEPDSPPSESLHDPRGDEQFALLESWKRQRTERLNRLLKIVADREAAEKDAIKKDVGEQNTVEEPGSTRPVSATSSSTAEPGSEEMRPASESPPLAEVRQPELKQEAWDQTLTRWKRSLPDRKVVVVVLLLACGAWWCWPESYGDVPETFRAMYDKLQNLRELENDKSGMENFVQTSQARLARIVPVLEKRSTPNRPESQWLLWMGRDCLVPMLKNPRQRDTKPEFTFRKLLAEWDRKFHPAAPAKNEAAKIARPIQDSEDVGPQPDVTKPDVTKPVNRAARSLKTAEESVNER